MPKKALITGITGQDGSYVAELRHEKGYEVHGLNRRPGHFNTGRIDDFFIEARELGATFILHYADLTEGSRLVTLPSSIAPNEVHHLGAKSRVTASSASPVNARAGSVAGVIVVSSSFAASSVATGKGSSDVRWGTQPASCGDAATGEAADGIPSMAARRSADGDSRRRGIRAR